MPSEEAILWIALTLIQGLGPARIKSIFTELGSVQGIFDAGEIELSSLEGIGPKVARSIVNGRKEALEKAASVVPDRFKAVPLACKEYPERLFNIYDPPPVLFIDGDMDLSDCPAVAIVGTRRATSYGREVTEDIVRGLVAAGIVIVSGLAIGIDACAHAAALRNGGRTVAVLGNSLDTVYPFCNRKLAEEITKSGALVSEIPKEIPVDKWMFPRRNRIISGLSMGTVVIEGSEDSGSLITARFALDQDREVFAVPGPAGKNLSAGPNSLIKQGAKLVENAGDILEELNIGYRKGRSGRNAPDLASFPEDERKILALIKDEAVHIDKLVSDTGMHLSDVYPVLTGIVVRGIAEELPGKYYRIR